MDTLDFSQKLTAAQALLFLYSRQTEDEQAMEGTAYDNGVGFSAVDAGFCSSVAKWILDGKLFTDKQHAGISKILPKYKRQLSGVNLSSIRVPETALNGRPKEDQPKKKGAGRLDFGAGKVLRFQPYIYPTRQIMNLGFSWQKPYYISHSFSASLVKKVIEMFGEVEIDEELQQALDQIGTVKELPEKVSDHPVLFPFQKEAIQFLHSSPRSMLALAPGLGKTATATFAADISGAKKVLVIAPLTLTRNWQREIKHWVNQDAIILHGSYKTWKTDKSCRWYVTNYETVVRNLDIFLGVHLDVLIVDESVMIKNRDAKRTHAVRDLSKKVERVWLLSGSPTTRFYDDLWAQANVIDAARFRSYWRFAKTYCEVEYNGWGTAVVANKPDADRAIREDLSDIYFCRTQDQVLNLPDWIIDSVYVQLGEKQLKLYKSMEEEFLASLPDGDVVLAPNVLSQLTRLIQLASNPLLINGDDDSPKWKAVEELLQFEQLPAIVWTTYIRTAELIGERLEKAGHRVAHLTGKTPTKERQDIVDRFQGGELDVIVAHPGVGKFGLTLTRARTAIYLERSYNGDDYYQSLHRVRRIGTTHSPHIIHLISEKPEGDITVDHVIDKILKFRKDAAIALTSGELRAAWERK